MNLSLLQISLLIGAMLLGYMIVDAGENKKLRLFHVALFIGGIAAIIALLLYPSLLSWMASFVGVEKGSDFIVYMSVIGLSITVFSLIQYQSTQQQQITQLCTNLALRDYNAITNIISTHENMQKSNYLFLIRAYNEATVLGGVVDEIINAGFSKIVIVNDGSSDNTQDVIEQLQKHNHNTHIIGLHHPINRGPGAANKTLFAFAAKHAVSLGCDWCVTYDADGQMSIEDMKQFMKHHEYDVVIGSRFVKGGSTNHMPFVRYLILQGGRVVTYIFNGLWLTDVSTGYRMYRTSILKDITLRSDRFSYQHDIIESIKNKNLSYKEVPVSIRYTDYSLQKGQSNMSAIKILIRLIYTSLFHR